MIAEDGVEGGLVRDKFKRHRFMSQSDEDVRRRKSDRSRTMFMRLPQLNDSSRKIFDVQGCGAEKIFSKGPAIKSYSHKTYPQESSDRGRLGGCHINAPLIRSDDFRAEPRRFRERKFN